MPRTRTTPTPSSTTSCVRKSWPRSPTTWPMPTPTWRPTSLLTPRCLTTRRSTPPTRSWPSSMWPNPAHWHLNGSSPAPGTGSSRAVEPYRGLHCSPSFAGEGVVVGAAGAMKQAMAKKEQVEFVKIERVSKQFDDAVAVDDVTLTINRGEIFALLGGSGSGKSTLLRILAGFEKPTEGRVLLDGQNITDLPPHKRPINMMFQSYALFPHMTVEQNIAFGLKQDKLSKQEITERVAEMLKLVHMSKFAKRKPHQLSGGQRQRVALARSLAKRPKLLLLDEPMGALDKKLRSQMQLELVEIIERVGVTCIMVTHDQE